MKIMIYVSTQVELPLYKVENLVSLRQTKHIQYKIRKIRILILSDVKLEQHKIFAFTKL